ncbi:COX5B-domain-containing protein [Xylariaceae sp. FL0804]|nr:COX5B-domain-containing protein [Xylariaceae sp. FL0804]
MFLRRSAFAAARRAAASPAASPAVRRSFAASAVRRDAKDSDAKADAKDVAIDKDIDRAAAEPYKYLTLKDVKTEDDLFGPGAAPGTVPTDLEQATGLERLEILGKMEGVDIFDMRPLDSSRKGTLDNPIPIKTVGDYQFAGCTGYPADSHVVIWLRMDRHRPMERCPECGGVYKMEYVGPPDDPHAHHDHPKYEPPKKFSDYVLPEYW